VVLLRLWPTTALAALALLVRRSLTFFAAALPLQAARRLARRLACRLARRLACQQVRVCSSVRPRLLKVASAAAERRGEERGQTRLPQRRRAAAVKPEI